MSANKTLEQWVQQVLNDNKNVVFKEPVQLTPLAGDAGFRCYYRINSQPSLLAVTAPPESGRSESAEVFARLANQLHTQGVPTPQIVAMDRSHNFLLVEDFGSDDLLTVLKTGLTNEDHNADSLYSEALMVLLRLQQIPRHAVSVPDYDEHLLMTELSLFGEWFVQRLLAYSLKPEEYQLLDTMFNFLVQQALSQPQVLVHRDFHSRNLICRALDTPGVIDFQDAVWGPATYDIVSLLKDCYIQWPPEQVKRWSISYGNMMIESGLITAVSESQWLQWLDMMGLQRHLKVLGIFSRLCLRDDKPRYLNDLPRVWRYVISVTSEYPETQAFYQWARKILQPIVESHDWYRAFSEPLLEA